MAKLYRVQFWVQSERHGAELPLDMLRYDGCYPARGEDAARATVRQRGESGHTDVPVKLESAGRSRDWQPSVERWASFGWRVEGQITRAEMS